METNITTFNKDIIANLVLSGDISKFSVEQKVQYYNMFCESLGLNPVTKPFQIIKFQNKEILYATKDATEQLRKINKVSVVEMNSEIKSDIMIVKVKVQDKDGRTDISSGAVNIKGMSGDTLANAIMKSETKAKRRATLSICGLGILDESEIETLPGNKEIKAIETNSIEMIKGEFNGEDITEQENINKLTALPENTKEGLRILTDKNSKKAIELCMMYDFDVAKIDAHIKSILDK